MEGYDLYTSHRTNKTGGGVAIYVNKTFKSNLVKKTNTDNIMESITVEISLANAKNIIITCIYRTPGTCIDTFNSNMDSLFGNINNNKIYIVNGDYNIDILNPHGNVQN